MAVNRKIRYYLNFEALDGFDEGIEDQYEEAEGIMLDIVHSISPSSSIGTGVYPKTEVLIEDLETHEIKTIDYRQLIKFIEE